MSRDKFTLIPSTTAVPLNRMGIIGMLKKVIYIYFCYLFIILFSSFFVCLCVCVCVGGGMLEIMTCFFFKQKTRGGGWG